MNSAPLVWQSCVRGVKQKEFFSSWEKRVYFQDVDKTVEGGIKDILIKMSFLKIGRYTLKK